MAVRHVQLFQSWPQTRRNGLSRLGDTVGAVANLHPSEPWGDAAALGRDRHKHPNDGRNPAGVFAPTAGDRDGLKGGDGVLHDPLNRLLEDLVSALDVTERKRAEENAGGDRVIGKRVRVSQRYRERAVNFRVQEKRPPFRYFEGLHRT